MAQDITKETFDTVVLASDKPVLVDFWAEWCGPCKMLAPTIEEIAEEYDGKAIVGKVNVDQSQELAEQYGIRGIPTLILFHNGHVKEQLVGVQSKQALKDMLEKYV